MFASTCRVLRALDALRDVTLGHGNSSVKGLVYFDLG